jgi:HK97 family phage portal protein
MGLLDRLRQLLTRAAPAPAWLHPYYLYQMGGALGLAASAEPVTAATAQGQATCYSALALISGALAAPTWDVVVSTSGGRRIDRSSAPARALTTLDYSEREGVVWDCWATGNGFIRHWRNNLGGRWELERLVASQVTILADAAGNISYKYMDPYSGREAKFAGSEIIHVRCRTLGLWPAVGVPPLLSGKDAIGLALAIQRYQGAALANASLPLGYLHTESKLDRAKAQEIGERWAQNYAGAASAGKTAVLEQGLKYETIDVRSFQELQLVEASRLAAREVAKLFGLTPAILGGGDEVNRSTAGVEVELAYRTCLFPASVRIADQVSRQLLSESERAAGLSVQIDLQEWLRGSGQALADMLSKLVLGNILSPDEARSYLNLPLAPNGTGASLLRPANMIPADQPPASPLAPAPPAQTSITVVTEEKKRLRRPRARPGLDPGTRDRAWEALPLPEAPVALPGPPELVFLPEAPLAPREPSFLVRLAALLKTRPDWDAVEDFLALDDDEDEKSEEVVEPMPPPAAAAPPPPPPAPSVDFLERLAGYLDLDPTMDEVSDWLRRNAETASELPAPPSLPLPPPPEALKQHAESGVAAEVLGELTGSLVRAASATALRQVREAGEVQEILVAELEHAQKLNRAARLAANERQARDAEEQELESFRDSLRRLRIEGPPD